MAVRPIDGNELYRIEKLLDTDIVRQDKVALNLLEQVLYDIQHVPTLTPPNEWVSVEERLPIKSGEYLAYTTDENIGLIEFDEDCGEFGFSKEYYQDGAYLDSEWTKADWITHWMPLSEPPGKDNNAPTKKPNEPLTLDELLKMDGEPVYVVFMPDSSGEKSQSWALVNVDEKYGEVYLVDSIPGASCYYDEIWADLEGIYRCPPEGEEDT